MFFENDISIFPHSYKEISQRVRNVNPVKYGATRNYINGAVTHLSPYISRGVISTKLVLEETLKRSYQPAKIEKFIQELAWRDYWQQIWVAKGNEINQDLKNQQQPIANKAIPKAIVEATTGIEAIDNAIKEFYKTGYLHNHVRMYIAAITCNVAQSHWKVPAQWMYYYLLDADWASNALSWQWTCGANSNKKYYANQENINKYCFTKQTNTFLDVPYAVFNTMQIPEVLQECKYLALKTPLPEKTSIQFDANLPTCIYNFYNLDPLWKNDIKANRILLLEPSHFEAYPVSKNTIDFILKLSENIENIQIYIGEFLAFTNEFAVSECYYKEHPLNNHYQGLEEARDWMFPVEGYHSSFFKYWKKCKKHLTY